MPRHHLNTTQAAIRPNRCLDMTMWPISTRVNKPENDDPALLDRADKLLD
jgi:putative SOS response-associated peptidase YedK